MYMNIIVYEENDFERLLNLENNNQKINIKLYAVIAFTVSLCAFIVIPIYFILYGKKD